MRLWQCGWLLAGVMLVGCHNGGHEHAKSECCGQEALVANQPAAKAKLAKNFTTYGGALTLAEVDAVPASSVLGEPDQYKDKQVSISGKVTQVCVKKGCWLRVADAGSPSPQGDIFIKFKDPPAGR